MPTPPLALLIAALVVVVPWVAWRFDPELRRVPVRVRRRR
jgi:hypothetical protein